MTESKSGASKGFSKVAVAIIFTGLLIGGAGGAIAAGQIGTAQIKDGAVTTRKLDNGAVTSKKIRNSSITFADLAASAKGAKVVQYIANGALFDTQDTAVVVLPGTWNATSLGNSSWSVQLLRNSPTVLFSLGQSAPAGESTANGFYISVNAGTASVSINASSYGFIDTIRITRTIITSSTGNTSVSRQSRTLSRVGG
jgi:hypothetical protein